ncbi:peptidase [Streptomyces sp. NPDC002054]|uniref:peptidase n=1 Tax=Streptomyces sp. NPDC002054 TaxID=3154663 RepID=UPI003320350A
MSVENELNQPEAVAETSATAGGGYPSFPVAPGYRVNVRSGPGTNYSVVRVLPYGAWVTINCQTPGTRVSGPYGTSNIWDCVGNGEFVADAYVKTGVDGYVTSRCG